MPNFKERLQPLENYMSENLWTFCGGSMGCWAGITHSTVKCWRILRPQVITLESGLAGLFEDTQSWECAFLLEKLGKKGCELAPRRLICCEFGIGERLCWGKVILSQYSSGSSQNKLTSCTFCPSLCFLNSSFRQTRMKPFPFVSLLSLGGLYFYLLSLLTLSKWQLTRETV